MIFHFFKPLFLTLFWFHSPTYSPEIIDPLIIILSFFSYNSSFSECVRKYNLCHFFSNAETSDLSLQLSTDNPSMTGLTCWSTNGNYYFINCKWTLCGALTDAGGAINCFDGNYILNIEKRFSLLVQQKGKAGQFTLLLVMLWQWRNLSPINVQLIPLQITMALVLYGIMTFNKNSFFLTLCSFPALQKHQEEPFLSTPAQTIVKVHLFPIAYLSTVMLHMKCQMVEISG